MASEETEVTSRHQESKPHRHYHHHHEEERGMEHDTLTRQSSIYSLTLDEIQNTVCDPGKHFGSMNMDEFLANIWNAEESHADAAPPPLHRQGSLTLPAPLCGKTVDEVWVEIHRQQSQAQALHHQSHVDHPSAAREPTLGEMTLEDFLIKAGVVRDGYGGSCAASPHPPTPAIQQQYGLSSYQMGGGGGNGVYQVVGEGTGYGGGGAANGNRGGMCLGGGGRRMGNGYGSPASPVSSDGLGGGQVDDTEAYGGGGGGVCVEGRGGRKRAADGTVEVVVERRQRRMIKNRESAARSRARKQAYTVELEAELNLLKEENARLKEDEIRVLALRKQLLLEKMAEQSQANAGKSTLRRCNSGPW